jgi:hypothetical protein
MRRHEQRTARLTWMIGAALVASVGAAPASAQSAATGGAKVERPKVRTVATAHCLNTHDGTLGGVFGRNELPLLAFTIGPKSAMADQMHASKAKFTGPGSYRNVVVMVYMGKTALEDTYGGLGTITVNPDWRSGSFTLNDKTSAGTWDCGAAVR